MNVENGYPKLQHQNSPIYNDYNAESENPEDETLT